MNGGKSNVMTCTRLLSMGQMNMRLNGKQLKEIYCPKHLGSQVAMDERGDKYVLQKMHEGYTA